MGIEVLPPHVNQSYFGFTVTDNMKIVYGLGAIKGVGEAAIDSLIQERELNGDYQSLHDLCMRLETQKFNRRSLEAMIRSGACDCFNQTRATLMHHLPRAMQTAEQHHRNDSLGQNDMFGGEQSVVREGTVEQKPEWDSDTLLAAERETLGLYFSGHPVDQYFDELIAIVGKSLQQRLAMPIAPVEKKYHRQDANNVRVAGLLIDMRLRNSPSGRIAFLTIDDNTERMNVAVFSDTYSQFKHLLIKDQILIIEGAISIDERTGKPSMRAKDLTRLQDARLELGRALLITVTNPPVSLVKELQTTLRPYCKGNCQVFIRYHSDSETAQFQLGSEWVVVPEQELLRRVKDLDAVVGVQVLY